MKTSTIHSLITARTLYDEAIRLVVSDDRHSCSAGLVMLQDALEIAVLAMLVEKSVDEDKSLESKGFDELIGELKKAGVKVPKSGTLKALNKQRVITKHYGQLAEPVTVRNYADAAEIAINSIVSQVLGKDLREILLTDLMDHGEARDLLTQAATLIEKERFLDGLVAIRQAIYVEIEHEYAINKWAGAEVSEEFGFMWLGRGGMKAPYWTRNGKWIEKNVKDPLDYVQIDHERLRLDGMEWGVNTAELENLRRLTPDVFRPEKGGPWHIQYDFEFPPNEATPSNASYCLDRAIAILLRKQQHAKAKRWPKRDAKFTPAAIYLEAPVFEKASQESKAVHRVNSDYEYTIHRVVSGFKPEERYYWISGQKPSQVGEIMGDWVFGFLLIQGEGDV